VLKHKDLEVQLANAKLQQSELKIVELTERSKKEKTIVNKNFFSFKYILLVFLVFFNLWIHI
jgi:hypothetical protein